MKKRKFQEGGTSALEDLAAGKTDEFKTKPRFSSDEDKDGSNVYERALKYVRSANKEDSSSTSAPSRKAAAPAPAPRRTPAPAPAPTPSAASIRRAEATPAPAPSPAPAPAPAAVSKMASDGDQYSGRARLTKVFGTEEARKNVEPDIKASDIASAIAAGNERRARHRANFFSPLKSLAAKIGTEEMRKRYKEEGYAKGGSVRGGGCEQRGKTRGRMY